ncbi:MAG: Na+/H+ antiporter NhaA [Leptospiraceae bacterium]|nr:Na+/H+ antiporter NhaA [Leptospiraceae bacterium]
MQTEARTNFFINRESASGLLLFAAALLAVLWANSAWADSYTALWQSEFGLQFANWSLQKPLVLWINDGLMAIFFFVVGLEIKRELMVGELSSLKMASLPIAAAIGGMLVPAILYIAFNLDGPGMQGWGIPMATDIAFSLGVLALLGTRAHPALKLFLTALAIVDDLGAVLVIAFFYTASLQTSYLLISLAILALLALLARFGLRSLAVFVFFGIVSWFFMLKSGVHATIAGVLLAFVIPIRTLVNTDTFVERMQKHITEFASSGPRGTHILKNPRRQAALHEIHTTSARMETPLERMEHALLPWVSFGIMPIFALANAGVSLQSSSGLDSVVGDSIFLGVLAGLLIGKPLGITLFSWLAIRLRIAAMPESVRIKHLAATGMLAGIGFTMSLFIANLAFGTDPGLDVARLAILAASSLAGIAGAGLLFWFGASRSKNQR